MTVLATVIGFVLALIVSTIIIYVVTSLLRDRIELLKLKVVADILKPRRLYSDIDQLYVPGPVRYE